MLKFSWESVQNGVDCLAHMLAPTSPKLIVAIARGGLIPATMLSHKMGGIPVEMITVTSYDGTRRQMQHPLKAYGWKPEYADERVVIVDDIMDTGETWNCLLYGEGRLAMEMKAHLATLVKKTGARFPNHDTYFAQVPSGVWVSFPWESEQE